MRKLYIFFTAMLTFVPISLYMHYSGYPGAWVFIASILAIIPLSKFLGKATEQIALHSNPMIAGLLNATFGNMIELVVSIFALAAGLIGLVKASIFGSIIFNMLFLIGISIFAGGMKHAEQKFDSMSAKISTTMLFIAVIGLAIPTLYALTSDGTRVHEISNWVSVVLAMTYICGLIFALVTHKAYFDIIDNYILEKIEPEWKKSHAFMILIGCTAFATWIASILVGSVESTISTWNLSEEFIGVVIIAILSNVAETVSAVTMALKDKVSISIEIGTSSAIQIALFVVPILVFVSSGFFNAGFSLVFNLFQIISALFAVLILNFLVADGRANWLEGLQLISVYLILTIALYFL